MSAILQVISRHWIFISSALLLVISAASLTPLSQLPDVSGSDKTHHLIAYGMLVIPVALAQPRHWIVVVAFFAAWSGAIELIQPYVNRYAEWMDLLANCAGLILGVGFAVYIRRTLINRS